RLTTQQDEAAGDHAPAQHPVQLLPVELEAGGRLELDLGERDWLGDEGCQRPALVPAGLRHLELLEGVPGAAVRALAAPSEGLATALAADEDGAAPGHLDVSPGRRVGRGLPRPLKRPPPVGCARATHASSL